VSILSEYRYSYVIDDNIRTDTRRRSTPLIATSKREIGVENDLLDAVVRPRTAAVERLGPRPDAKWFCPASAFGGNAVVGLNRFPPEGGGHRGSTSAAGPGSVPAIGPRGKRAAGHLTRSERGG
jgi:hypothetical protein